MNKGKIMTENKYDFVSLQVDYWDSPWQNRHGFLWELSKKCRIFFLSPPFYIIDLMRHCGSSKTKLHGYSVVNSNLYSYVPPRYLPYNYRFKRIDQFVATKRDNLIQKQLMALKFDRPILIIWHPNYTEMIGKFREKLVIYYKYDHYAGYIGGSGHVSPKEKLLLEKADIVFVTSQGLYDLHKNDCKEIHVVPNGVDYDYFSKSLTDEIAVPLDMQLIPKPRIGYVGVNNDKVDFKLLNYLCRARPDWSIVLVGPVKVKLPEFKKDLSELRQKKNCYFLGEKQNRAVPSYIKHLDVCMMCYLVNEWTFYGYPLKMHEYLACGKPCISADLPEVRLFSNVLKIAHSYKEWHDLIDQELKHMSPDSVRKRMAVAKNNSWNARVNSILTILNDKFESHNQ